MTRGPAPRRDGDSPRAEEFPKLDEFLAEVADFVDHPAPCAEEFPKLAERSASRVRAAAACRRATRPLVINVRATCVWSVFWALLLAGVARFAVGVSVTLLVAYVLGSSASALSTFVATFLSEGDGIA